MFEVVEFGWDYCAVINRCGIFDLSPLSAYLQQAY